MYVVFFDYEKMIFFGCLGKYLVFIVRIDDVDFWS